MFPKGGMGNLMKQAKEMQTKMAKAQEEVKLLKDEGTSGGGLVKIIATAKGEIKKEGAKRIFACASHAVFSPPSYERLSSENLFEQVIVTNSIPVLVKNSFPQLKVLSVANMLGEAIWRIHEESSVSSMFR